MNEKLNGSSGVTTQEQSSSDGLEGKIKNELQSRPTLACESDVLGATDQQHGLYHRLQLLRAISNLLGDCDGHPPPQECYLTRQPARDLSHLEESQQCGHSWSPWSQCEAFLQLYTLGLGAQSRGSRAQCSYLFLEGQAIQVSNARGLTLEPQALALT